jgi:hypothetical protein
MSLPSKAPIRLREANPRDDPAARLPIKRTYDVLLEEKGALVPSKDPSLRDRNEGFLICKFGDMQTRMRLGLFSSSHIMMRLSHFEVSPSGGVISHPAHLTVVFVGKYKGSR